MLSSFEIFCIAFMIALLAGWVDTVSGGGGLITLPGLILLGVSPSVALATNKFQGSSGTFFASWHFVKKGIISIRSIIGVLGMIFLGSAIGTYLVLKIDNAYLMKFLPILLIAMGIYVLLSKKMNDEKKNQRISLQAFGFFPAPLLGFYDGFFGPGTGTLMMLALSQLCGRGVSEATAYAKVFNFTSNISSLFSFIVFGRVDWEIGLIMVLGQMIGARIGVYTVMTKGVGIIKPMVVLTCFAMALRLIFFPPS